MTGLALQSDGDVLIPSAGGAVSGGVGVTLGFVTRLTASGTLDTTFGTNGAVEVGSGEPAGVTFTASAADGTIVTAYTGSTGTTAVRLLASAAAATPTAAALTGALIGTTGSYTNSGSTIAKAG